MIKNGVSVSVENGIFAVDGLKTGEYDRMAKFYDTVMGNALYNAIMWGNRPEDYSRFAAQSLPQVNFESNKKQNQISADIGCGSLRFTRQAYNEYESGRLILCDMSLAMLRYAQKRISSGKTNVHFLRADALDLPFCDNALQTVLSFGLLHVVMSPEKLLREFFRVLKKGGELHLTCLCGDRSISGYYLNFLKKKKLVSINLKGQEICRMVEDAGFQAGFRVVGGMAYIDAVKPLKE